MNSKMDDEETKTTFRLIENINITKVKESIMLYRKSVVMILADVFENFMTKTTKDFDISPLYNVSLPGNAWQCDLKITGLGWV